MTTIEPPICLDCVHLTITPDSTAPTCDAFPDRIPNLIWTGQIRHTSPYPGDHGIQFESKDGGPPPPENEPADVDTGENPDELE